MTQSDSIFALASGKLPAGVAIIRISGAASDEICQQLVGKLPAPRFAHYCCFRDPASGEIVDKGLALRFQAPASFTGEDCLEIHCHGSIAVVAKFYDIFSNFPNVRLAEPGEFSRRALMNARLDLTEVEGLADLIAAETEWQRQITSRAANGASRALYEKWRQQLIALRGLYESQLDFADEEDIPQDLLPHHHEEIRKLRDAISCELDSPPLDERLTHGFKIAIVGAPNSGKSSLFNNLSQRDAALVSDIAGTTRDIVETHVNINGYPVNFLDTAGLRASDDELEQMGMARSRQAMADADLILYLDKDNQFDTPDIIEHTPRDKFILVKSQSDLSSFSTGKRADIAISIYDADSIIRLSDRISQFLEQKFDIGHFSGHFIKARQQAHLRETEAALQELLVFIENNGFSGYEEIHSEYLRRVSLGLSALAGQIRVEDILGQLVRITVSKNKHPFSRFRRVSPSLGSVHN